MPASASFLCTGVRSLPGWKMDVMPLTFSGLGSAFSTLKPFASKAGDEPGAFGDEFGGDIFLCQFLAIIPSRR